MADTHLESFIEKELSKVRGVYYPVKAGFLRRLLTTKAPLSKLHPNPNDEFCSPKVGPNNAVFSEYVSAYGNYGGGASVSSLPGSLGSPILVEKTNPDGYMILNGHHRWAAASRVGVKKLPIQIVNLTQKKDVQRMLERTNSDRRVTLDLDETVFRTGDDPCIEKPLPFPFGRIYKERLRRGIPALFHFLKEQGYDIWVYTAKYYSLEYVRAYFRYYRIPVTGIVTGAARKASHGDAKAQFETMLAPKYACTLHIDNDSVLKTRKGSKEYEVCTIRDPGAGWTAGIMDIVGGGR